MTGDYEKLPVRPKGWHNDRTFFFKYMTAGTAAKVLEGGRLRWSTPGTLNDPYDTQFDLTINVDAERIRQLSLDKMWAVFRGEAAARPGLGMLLRHLGLLNPNLSREQFDKQFMDAVDEGHHRAMSSLPDVQADVRRLMADSKLLCLTTDATAPTMWAYYADNHAGVVLRFRSIPFLDSCFGMARAVNYVEDVPALLDEEAIADIAAGGKIDHRRALDALVYTKGSDWAHEREWRIFSGGGRDKEAAFEDLPFHPLELSAIIFGMRTPATEREKLSELATIYPNFEILESVRASNSLKMESRLIE